MKHFLVKTFSYVLCLIAILSIVIWADVFQVFWRDEPLIEEVKRNLSVEKLNTYCTLSEKRSYNSFILGNSIANNISCQEWKTFLDEGATTFNFCSNSESIFGILKKIEFLISRNDSLKNIIIILDDNILCRIDNDRPHLFMVPPQISGESRLFFYSKFVQAQMHPLFLLSIINYKINGTIRGASRHYLKKDKWRVVNLETYDRTSVTEAEIQKDSVKYFSLFDKRGGSVNEQKKKHKQVWKSSRSEAIMLLDSIFKLLNKHCENYSIIIPPKYNYMSINEDQRSLINSFFGSSHVFDFSQDQNLCGKIGFFYDREHFRPMVGSMILRRLYE